MNSVHAAAQHELLQGAGVPALRDHSLNRDRRRQLCAGLTRVSAPAAVLLPQAVLSVPQALSPAPPAWGLEPQ